MKNQTIEANFYPRPYQCDIMRAALIEGYKRMVIVGHRRLGKDTLCFNIAWPLALMKPGLYFYLLPKIGQSSNVIFYGRGKDGVTFLDRIPHQFIKDINSSTQTVTFINGSRLVITGADNYKVLIGTNTAGVIFSEFQRCDPLSWEYVRPILAENDGFAFFIGTALGHNHLYELYSNNLDNPSWYTSKLSVADTHHWDGSPIISEDVIEEERRAGMPEAIIQQEFYCSFEAAIEGAYFSQQMSDLRQRGRIGDFDCTPGLLVFTAWDLGMRDKMAVGFFQQKPNGDFVCFEHIEDNGKELGFFIQKLREIKETYGFKKYGVHFVPHDIRVRELGTGRTRFEIMQREGMKLCVVPKMAPIERIQCARNILPDFQFHKRCKRLIQCLDEFHEKVDRVSGRRMGPDHGDISHSADMFTYFAAGFLNAYDPDRMNQITSYAKLYPLS